MHALLVELIETMANDYADRNECHHRSHSDLLKCASQTLRENGLLDRLEEKLVVADNYESDRNARARWAQIQFEEERMRQGVVD